MTYYQCSFRCAVPTYDSDSDDDANEDDDNDRADRYFRCALAERASAFCLYPFSSFLLSFTFFLSSSSVCSRDPTVSKLDRGFVRASNLVVFLSFPSIFLRHTTRCPASPYVR